LRTADTAGLFEEVRREPLVEGILLYTVRVEVKAPSFLLRLLLRGHAVLLQDFLIGLLRVDVVVLRPKGYEVAAFVLREAMPLSGGQVCREAVLLVPVEGAEAG